MDITVSKISKCYKNRAVLNDISLCVHTGETVGILGRNGCGKSTLLSIIAGTEKADRGQIIFSESGGRKLVGYLPQVNPLIEEVSVSDNLSLWIDDMGRMDEVLKAFDFDGISAEKVSKLSGGMKRRVAIMCALANSPKLLIMDEPTSALDIEFKKMIHDMMRAFAGSGGSIILVTHEKEEIDMCDRCYEIIDGKLFTGGLESE